VGPEHLVDQRAADGGGHRWWQHGLRDRRASARASSRARVAPVPPEALERTQRFYEKYGPKTIVIARFVPIIRTFAPVLAGVGQMRYRRFLTYNVAGGIGWVASMSWAGYLLGQTVPNISKHMHLLVIVIIVLSCIPIAVEVYRERRKPVRRR
jgi:membrane-associated protein